MYTMRSGYEVARQRLEEDVMYSLQQPSLNPLKEQVWKLKTSNKVRHFLWQALSGAIAVNERLVHRHVHQDRTCPRCGNSDETINHALFTCPPVRQVWAMSNIPNQPMEFPTENLWRNMDYLFSRIPNQDNLAEFIRSFPLIIWFLWKARNDKVYRNIDRSPQETLELARKEAMD